MRTSAPVPWSAPAPAPDARWDALTVFLFAYVCIDIGRVHQLFPILLPLHPALLTAVGSLILCATTRPVAANWRRLRGSILWLMAGILGWAILSVPGAVYPGGSFAFLRDNLMKTMLMTLVIALSIRGPRDVTRMLGAILTAALLYSGVVLQRFDIAPGQRLANLYTYDANDLALFLSCSLPIALYLVLRAKGVVRRGLPLLGLLVMTAVMIRTGSRGGFLALIAVALVVLVAWRGIRLAWRVGGVALGVLVFGFFANAGYWQMMSTMEDLNADYNVTSTTGRVQVWKRGIGYMMENPVFGVGVYDFESAEGHLSVMATESAPGRGFKWSAAHNSFVQIGAELGIPGLLLFLALCVELFRRSIRMARSELGGAFNPMLADVVVAMLAGFYVAGFFLSQAYSQLLYFIVAMVLGLDRLAAPLLARRQRHGAAGISAPWLAASAGPASRRGRRGRRV